ncbi:MAG: HAD family hydrolase [Candidatus Obscuribacterales bacterium]|nr:HAD family hydrolase [Candidatus Obscuribacterales bacterium]
MVDIDVVGFDADDTLWHNENLFSLTQESFRQLLAEYGPTEDIATRLTQTELNNLKHFGYGVKGFTLSMIETALELTDNRIDAKQIKRMIELGKEMLSAPVELLDHVEKTITTLALKHRLMLVTKGDLFDQESKLARSGLGPFFSGVEIVSEKNPATYTAILKRNGIAPERFFMVGNSMKSDVIPVLDIGGWAAHVPYRITWVHEQVSDYENETHRFFKLQNIGECIDLLGS